MTQLLIGIAVKNDATGLWQTLESIQCQSDRRCLVSIVDPGNGSRSSEAPPSFPDLTIHLDHRPDTGIAHAFNKILLNGGQDWTHALFLGAGDRLLAPDRLERLLALIAASEPTTALFACGVDRTASDGSCRYAYRPRAGTWHHLLWKMPYPHQGLVTARACFERYGLFDPRARYAMDYRWLLGTYRDRPPVVIAEFALASWMEGGIGTNRTWQVLREYHRSRCTMGTLDPFSSTLILLASYLKSRLPSPGSLR